MHKVNLKSLFISLLFIPYFVYAQVGINTNAPDLKSILDIISSDKGILIPRLNTIARDTISPTKDSQQGLLIYNTDEDCFNYWHKIDKKWKSLCGQSDKADFTADCSNVKLAGEYKNGVEVTNNEYITVSVTVTKKGAYSIKAMSTVDNGYFFEKTGEFLTTGTFILNIPAYGTPINITTPAKDEFSIQINGVAVAGCTFAVEVTDATNITVFDIERASILTEGIYMQGVALDGTNQVKLNLIVKSGIGNPYSISTEVVDGISFSGSGVLTDPLQPIILQGTGTPLSGSKITLRILSNSKLSNTIYYINVELVKPAKRLLALGSIFQKGTNVGEENSSVNDMLLKTTNFGTDPASVVKVQPFVNNGTEISSDSGPGIIKRATIDDSQLATFLSSGIEYVDIVVVGFDWIPTLAQAQALADYTKNGGVLLMFSEDVASVKLLMQSVFDNTVDSDTNTTYNGAGSVYKITGVNDPVLNGPFGSISGTYWGKDDLGGTSSVYACYVTNLPVEDIVLYTTNFNYNSSDNTQKELPYTATAFRHKTYPFIFVGDGGFNSGVSFSSNVKQYPFKTGSKTIGVNNYSNYPLPRSGFGAEDNTYRTNVYNSVFFANAIAWAIDKAEEKRLK